MSEYISPRNLDQPVILSVNPAGIGAIDVADPAKPLPVLVGPLDLKPLDHIDLYWGAIADPVSSYDHPRNAPPINDFVTLAVDTGNIESARDPVPVRYRFTPFPGSTSQDSDITHIRVKLEAPGGIDIDPATPYENEALRPPRVQPPAVIVDPQGVRVIVTPYEQMSEGDRIRVSWAESTVDHPPLTAAEAGTEVVIPIPPQIIETVGDSSKLPVRYEVHDVVGNWSKRSPATEVVVSIGSR
ncbi:hypothetical protein HX867_30320 [Pseudomonas gingeri]|uniref:hypothetical protein n=1 Tax=Pseudomonas gingeri TaxID=117681 RepID=UPI0015A48F70|nr:hypothetical protein [Pseudomonas gingeri]NVZ66411.1 hypothetical protein [Pseudomonas gingeri]NVZ77284.1 hypothetical protein [Pseudomonas gingeri]